MTGRPREFEMRQVLASMADVFWEKGYEGTSLADILAATGLQKGSLYKAFANKQEMFRMSLEHYINENHADKGRVIEASSSPLEGIEAMLKRVASESCSSKSDFRGCLAVRSMMDRTAHDDEVRQVLVECLSSAENGLEKLIRSGQEIGEIRNDLPARTLAEALYCYTSGMLATTGIGRSRARTKRLLDFARRMLEPQ